MKKQKKKIRTGFTLLELLTSMAVFFVVMAILSGFIVWMYQANIKVQAMREVSDNLERAMETILREAKRAENVYTPTTSVNQLSLKTFRSLPEQESYTYIDFFKCGSKLCLKREGQNPIALTSDKIEVVDFTVDQLQGIADPSSVQIVLTLDHSRFITDPDFDAEFSAVSTAVLRVY